MFGAGRIWNDPLAGRMILCDSLSAPSSDMSTSNRSDDQLASYSSKGPAVVDHIVKPDLVGAGQSDHLACVPR